MVSQVKQKGFTIVELLIVIVVIAILAAISMAAYTSITARANTSTAAAAAKAVRDVAQTYNGANGAFPTTKALFVSGGTDPVAKLPSDIVFAANLAEVQNATNPKTVLVERSPGTGTITGFRVTYKDFAAGDTATVQTTVGQPTPSTPTYAIIAP